MKTNLPNPIGYWSEGKDEYPVPVPNSATNEQVEQMLVAHDKFVRSARERFYKGTSMCRICGCRNGSSEYQKGSTVIPEGLKHYIVEHKVLVPKLLELFK